LIQNGVLDTSLPNRDIASVTNPGGEREVLHHPGGRDNAADERHRHPDSDSDTTGTGTNQAQAVVETESLGCSSTAFAVLTFERSEMVNGGGAVTQVNLDETNEGFFFMVPDATRARRNTAGPS
jgi:hypothetical protein